MRKMICIILLASCCGGLLTKVQQQNYQRELSQQVLRFHVLANSDSKEDQQLKLKVRDAVGGYMSQVLQTASSRQECEEIVKEQMGEIQQIAIDIIAREGCDYGVTTSLETVDFPEKTYGEYTFPAGNYEALRICIGEAKGANWWCVMYPNMCFTDSVYEVVKDDARENLKEVLTVGQYQKLIESKDREIRFRLLEELDLFS